MDHHSRHGDMYVVIAPSSPSFYLCFQPGPDKTGSSASSLAILVVGDIFGTGPQVLQVSDIHPNREESALVPANF